MSSSARRTLVLIGDVHDETERLARSLELVSGVEADLALLTGDVGADPPWHRAQRRTHRHEHDESVRRVISHVEAALRCPVVFVPGNHDLDDPPADVAAANADGRIVDVNGFRVAGFGGAEPVPTGFPYEWTEEQAEERLAGLFGELPKIDVFLSHAPPSGGGLDRTRDRLSVGSHAVRRWLERVRPKLFVCGHIHEAWGLEWLDSVPCVNAGALGAPYGQDLAWIVEWSDGPRRVRAVRGRPGATRTWEMSDDE